MYPTPIKDLNYQFPDRSTIPLCEPLLDPGVVCLDVSRDLPYSYETRTSFGRQWCRFFLVGVNPQLTNIDPTTPTVLENILDPSHVPYTHHRTIGRRENATPIPLRLTSDLTVDGFTGEFERQVATSPMLRRNLNRVSELGGEQDALAVDWAERATPYAYRNTPLILFPN